MTFQNRLSDELKSSLLSLCKGRPLPIHMIKVIAEQEYAADNDMAASLLEPLLHTGECDPDSVAQRLLPITFNELPQSQKETLLTVALFEGVAQLESVCKVD